MSVCDALLAIVFMPTVIGFNAVRVTHVRSNSLPCLHSTALGHGFTNTRLPLDLHLKESTSLRWPNSTLSQHRIDVELHTQSHENLKNEAELWKINGTFYNLRNFAASHRGGAYAIELSADHDVTDLFFSYHNSRALNALKPFRRAPPQSSRPLLCGEADGPHAAVDPRIQKLRTLVEHQTGSKLHELKTPAVGWATNGVLGLCYVIAILSWYKAPSIANAAATGFLGWAFGGFIQHEACHGALSKNKLVNHVARFAIVPWADPRTWFIRHVVKHHPYTNTKADSDFKTAEGKLMVHHGSIAGKQGTSWQVALQLFAGPLVPFIYSTADTVEAIRRRAAAWWESGLYVAVTVLWFALHYARNRSLLLCLLPHLFFGLFFSNITQWNHIQEAATPTVVPEVPEPASFVAHQAGACVDCAHDNFAWSLLCIFLNFQTLHHILPSVSHHHFLWNRPLRVAILNFLRDEGITPNVSGPLEAVVSHTRWLSRVGQRSAANARRAVIREHESTPSFNDRIESEAEPKQCPFSRLQSALKL